MIDTLILDYGTDFHVDNADLIFRRAWNSYEEGFPTMDSILWTDPKRGTFQGYAADFFPREDLPLAVKIKKWRDGKVHLAVKCSIPNLLYNDNFHSVNTEELNRAADLIGRHLRRIGILIRPEEGRIIRVDIFKQGQIEVRFDRYAELFRQFKIPKTDVQERDTSFLWKSRKDDDWALNVYDKGIQSGSEDPERKVLRVELQLKRRKTIKRVLGFDTFKELLSGIDRLSEAYSSFLQPRLLLNNEALVSPTHIQNVSDYTHAIEYHRKNSGTRWRALALEEIGRMALVKEMGLENSLSLLLGEDDLNSTDRVRRSRMVNKLRIANVNNCTHYDNTKSQCFKQLKNIILK